MEILDLHPVLVLALETAIITLLRHRRRSGRAPSQTRVLI